MSTRYKQEKTMAHTAQRALMVVLRLFVLVLAGGAFAIFMSVSQAAFCLGTHAQQAGGAFEAALSPDVAFADTSQIDTSRNCSLKLKFDGITTTTAIGVPFHAVKVADVETDGTFSNYLDWFKSYSGYLSDVNNWNAVAYNAKLGMPDTITTPYNASTRYTDNTSSEYIVDFSDAGRIINTGLYLVYADYFNYADIVAYEYYPMLVQLPTYVDASNGAYWDYNVTCYVKTLGDPLTLDGAAGDDQNSTVDIVDVPSVDWVGGSDYGSGSVDNVPDIDRSSSISFDFPDDDEEDQNGGEGSSGTSGGHGSAGAGSGSGAGSGAGGSGEHEVYLVRVDSSEPATVVTSAIMSRLPQTGLLLWPVVLLVVCGVSLVCIGVIKRKMAKAKAAARVRGDGDDFGDVGGVGD